MGGEVGEEEEEEGEEEEEEEEEDEEGPPEEDMYIDDNYDVFEGHEEEDVGGLV